MERLEAEANDYLGQVAGRLKTAGLAVRTVVQRGPAAEEIVDYAEQMDIQQIVMATHGYSGISRWRHGSVAERVLQSAGVPVLMVCAKGGEGISVDPMACQRILVPLDGSDRAEQVLPPAVSVSGALDAEIVLLRVPIGGLVKLLHFSYISLYRYHSLDIFLDLILFFSFFYQIQ